MGDNTSRRSVLRRTGALALAGSVGVAGCLGDDSGGGGDETLRIGAIQPLSGALEYYGRISLMGFYSGLAYKHDVDPLEAFTSGTYTIEPDDGPTYELYLEDTGFDVETAENVATNLVADEDVDLLFGASSSDAARRIIPNVVDEANVPYLIGPAADGDITASSEHCHDLAFRASEHTAMDARAGGRYVAQQGDVSTVAIFAVDGAFGRGVANNYREVLENEGIEVLEPRYVEQGYSEFGGLFDEAVADGADGVVGGFTFLTLPNFLETGMDYDVQIFGGFAELVTTQEVSSAVENVFDGEEFTGEDIQEVGLGPFTTRYHWNQYDNEINDEFVDLHVEAYDVVPDLFSAGTFVAASALSQAIDEAGSTDGEEIADAMRGMTVTDTPKGEDGYTFQEHNNQAASAMTVAWPVPTSEEYQDTWDASIMPGEPIETLESDEVMVPAEEASCDLS
ncbi:ABC transporter substrate-binding protein [Natribaculum luteum]|uniref:ABC transporter substrate-binding protein n=1 Tax=Natribaculum luteum TaxID=1586232 RepID=A0ABD5P459_9EURY